MAWETRVQSQVKSNQRLKKWFLMSPCLTLTIIRYWLGVKWSNPGKGVMPSPTPWCRSNWKESLRITLDNSCQLYLLSIYIYIYIYVCIDIYLSLLIQKQYLKIILWDDQGMILVQVWTKHSFSSEVSEKINKKTIKICTYICIYPTPLQWVGYDTRSIFRWNTTGLNSKFFFY